MREADANSRLPRIKKTREELIRDDELKKFVRKRQVSALAKHQKSLKDIRGYMNRSKSIGMGEDKSVTTEAITGLIPINARRPIKSSLKKGSAYVGGELNMQEGVSSKFGAPSASQIKSKMKEEVDSQISRLTQGRRQLRSQREVTEKANYVVPDVAGKAAITSPKPRLEKEKEIPTKPYNIRYVATKQPDFEDF